MLCPKCEGTELEPVRMQRDLEIDRCPRCDGVWLDRSEVYAFVDRPNQAYEEFKALVGGMAPAGIGCPRCGRPMLQVRIDSAELPFEACARCGGNWFDKGEVQKLCAYLDERWTAAGSPGAAARVAVGPRAPTEAELASWLGPDRALGKACALAAACAALAAGLSEPARTPGMVVSLAFAAMAAGWVWFSLRGWYIRGCVVVDGEIGHYADEVADEAEVRVLFTYEGYPYQVTRIIGYRSPLDVGAGGSVQALVHPLAPRRAFITVPVDKKGAPWSDEDRRRAMSPHSLAGDAGLRAAPVSAGAVYRLACLVMVLLGLAELLPGKDVLHGFAMAAGGLLLLILDLMGLTRWLPRALSGISGPRRRRWNAAFRRRG